MQNKNPFPRAIEEMHSDDMSAFFGKGYVSDRTLDLYMEYMRREQLGSVPETIPEAA